MEDFGDYIFYIIAAVIGLITTLGKKKKNAAKRTTVNSEAIDREVFAEGFDEAYSVEPELSEEIVTERDFWMEPADDEVVDPGISVASETILLSADQEGSYSEPMAERFKHEGISAMAENISDQISEHDISIAEQEAKKDGIEDILSDFELRRAIIYSEILNRKDY